MSPSSFYENIEYLNIVVLILSSGDAVLFNAEQSTTHCDSSGFFYIASLAIDGDWYTPSITTYATGTHWWHVSMTNMTVYQVKLSAGSNEDITVSLYSGETLAGECQSHTGGYYSRETLSCDRVAADRVRLTRSSTSRTTLYVYEIRITGTLIETIGL